MSFVKISDLRMRKAVPFSLGRRRKGFLFQSGSSLYSQNQPQRNCLYRPIAIF